MRTVSHVVIVVVLLLSASVTFAAGGAATHAAAVPQMVKNDPYASTYTFLIPAMGSVPGGGTFFRSALVLCNARAQPQDVDVFWFPQGSSGSPTTPVYTASIPAATCLNYEDFVGNQLHLTALGAMRFVAVFPGSHTPDSFGTIDGFSRIWSPVVGTSGTVSQSFQSVSESNLDPNAAAYAMGMRQDQQFRCNIGIVNLSAVSRDFVVHVYGNAAQTEFTVTVPPYSLVQRPLPAGNWGWAGVYFTPQGNVFGSWSAYASSVDNSSGDAWTNKASPW